MKAPEVEDEVLLKLQSSSNNEGDHRTSNEAVATHLKILRGGVEEEDSQPPLDALTDVDASSVDSSILYESDASLCSTAAAGRPRVKRTVSFSKIEVREYALTVGDHPLCQDGLPLSLDWEHTESTEINICCSRERMEKYQMPPRLSYEEKRDRLIATTDFTDERARNKELGQVIQRMQSWWIQHPVLPMPNLFDIDEEAEAANDASSSSDDDDDKYHCQREAEDDFVFQIEPPKLEAYVVQWRRNPYQRSR